MDVEDRDGSMVVINCTRNVQNLSMHVDDIKKSLDNDGVIVYPTDTLYAIGCNPFKETAVRKTFEIKKRPLVAPLSIAVHDMEGINEIAVLNDLAIKVIKKFLPGPMTLLLRKKDNVPDILTSGSKNVAVRIPDHPVALELLRRVGPLTATSANLHGANEPTNMEIPFKQFKNSVDFYIDCGKTQYGKPSTIVDLSAGTIKIIREGALSINAISIDG